MKLKKIFPISGQWIAFSAIMLLLWMTTMGIMTSLLMGGTGASSEASADVLLGMAAVCFINAAVIIYLILRSRWRGIKLVAFVAFVHYIVQFFMGGVEVIFFQSSLKISIKLVYAQLASGAVWVLVGLPVIRMMKGTARETAVTLGLIFPLVMNSQHIPPNPYMPGMVRLAHFIETASSNFLWGMLIVWLLHRRHASIPDLIRKQEKQASLKPARLEKS